MSKNTRAASAKTATAKKPVDSWGYIDSRRKTADKDVEAQVDPKALYDVWVSTTPSGGKSHIIVPANGAPVEVQRVKTIMKQDVKGEDVLRMLPKKSTKRAASSGANLSPEEKLKRREEAAEERKRKNARRRGVRKTRHSDGEASGSADEANLIQRFLDEALALYAAHKDQAKSEIKTEEDAMRALVKIVAAKNSSMASKHRFNKDAFEYAVVESDAKFFDAEGKRVKKPDGKSLVMPTFLERVTVLKELKDDAKLVTTGGRPATEGGKKLDEYLAKHYAKAENPAKEREEAWKEVLESFFLYIQKEDGSESSALHNFGNRLVGGLPDPYHYEQHVAGGRARPFVYKKRTPSESEVAAKAAAERRAKIDKIARDDAQRKAEKDATAAGGSADQDTRQMINDFLARDGRGEAHGHKPSIAYTTKTVANAIKIADAVADAENIDERPWRQTRGRSRSTA